MTVAEPKTLRGRRPGYSLMEVLVAVALGVTLSTLVVQGYQGLARAQNATQGQADLRQGGQDSLNHLQNLTKQCVHLFDRPAQNTSDDPTWSWLSRVPVPGLASKDGLELVSPGPFRGATGGPDEFLLPRINERGGFVEDPTATRALDPKGVGNALAFLTQERSATITPSKNEPSADFTEALYGALKARDLRVLRLHVLFVARRPLGNEPEHRPGSPFTYTLMHWSSPPFLDRNDAEGLLSEAMELWPTAPAPVQKSPPGLAKKVGLPPGGIPSELVDYANGMLKRAAQAARAQGCLDPLEADGRVAFSLAEAKVVSQSPGKAIKGMQVINAMDTLDLTDTTALFPTGDFRRALKLPTRSTHASLNLAFNTEAGGPFPAVPVPQLAVPALGLPEAGVPYGFECAVAGPPHARHLLMRLSLSARALQSRGTVGESFEALSDLSR